MQAGMASTISNGLQKVVNVDGAASNSPKLVLMAEHTFNYDAFQNAMIATDFD